MGKTLIFPDYSTISVIIDNTLNENALKVISNIFCIIFFFLFFEANLNHSFVVFENVLSFGNPCFKTFYNSHVIFEYKLIIANVLWYYNISQDRQTQDKLYSIHHKHFPTWGKC